MTRVMCTTASLLLWLVATARAAEPEDTTICALTSTPAAHSGKMVTVRATVVTDYHGKFLQERRCKKLLLLVLPEGSAMAPAVELKADSVYKRFEEALHDYRPGSAQPKKRVEARFTGRFEYLPLVEAGRGSKASVPAPLGAQWQLVLQSVSALRLR